MTDAPQPWHHSPLHVFVPDTMYIVTASTLHKRHHFHGQDRLRTLQDTLFEATFDYGWSLQAWAVFPNHYHFVGKSPEQGKDLKVLTQRLHSQTAREVNRQDGTSGRQVWFQCWDTCLTYEKSYYARLNYVHNNPVKHGVVPVADQYLLCSAAWFRAKADPVFRKKVESFKYDRIKIVDDS